MEDNLHGKVPHVRKKPVMDGGEYLEKLESKNLTPDGGALIPDPTPLAPPVGYIKQPSITERIREMVRSEHLRLAAESADAETFEEADDFDVGDDFDPQSPYEEIFDPPIPVSSTGGSASPGGGGGGGGETTGKVPVNPAGVSGEAKPTLASSSTPGAEQPAPGAPNGPQ